MKPKEMARVIEQLGLKKYHVALELKIHPSVLSRYLNNSGDMTAEQNQKVTEYLNKLRKAV